MVVSVAHQFPKKLADLLTEVIPEGIQWIGLAPERAFDLPPGVEILLATVPRGGNIAVPSSPPTGWPGDLKWLHTVSTGVDEFPPWIFEVPVVTCSRGANSNAIAEYVISALLLVEKQLLDIWITDRDQWQQRNLGTLNGRTLGLLGFGSIGQAIVRLAAPFGMRILAHRRSSLSTEIEGVTSAPLEQVVREADHLAITLPLTKQTHHLLNRETFALMKSTAHLVNVSRGGIVDQAALVNALDDGRLALATLDVTEPEPLSRDHPLYHHPKIRISPHLSWSGGDWLGFADIFRDNLARFVQGEELLNRVYPDRGY